MLTFSKDLDFRSIYEKINFLHGWFTILTTETSQFTQSRYDKKNFQSKISKYNSIVTYHPQPAVNKERAGKNRMALCYSHVIPNLLYKW